MSTPHLNVIGSCRCVIETLSAINIGTKNETLMKSIKHHLAKISAQLHDDC
jgi:hypothetical protein